jgi:hypothetical protein
MALSECTMLNPPELATYACFGKASGITGTRTLVDTDTQVEVEFWHYNPVLLSKHPGIADPLSLCAAFARDADERVQLACEALLYETLEGKNG